MELINFFRKDDEEAYIEWIANFFKCPKFMVSIFLPLWKWNEVICWHMANCNNEIWQIKNLEALNWIIID